MKSRTIKDIRSAAVNRRRRRERRRRFTAAVVVVAAIALAGTFFALPRVVKSQLEKRGSAELHRSLVLEKVTVNPLRWSVELTAGVITDPDGSEFARWDRLWINFDLSSLIRGEWRFDAIEVEGFAGEISIDAEGRANFSDLLAVSTESPAVEAPVSERTKPFYIGSLVVSDARVEYIDLSHGAEFATTLGPISFSLENFHSTQGQRSPYAFEATTEAGEHLRWRGDFSAAPLVSRGKVELQGIRLTKYAPFYRHRVQFDVTGGVADVTATYEIDLSRLAADWRLSDAEVVVSELALVSREQAESFFAAREIRASGIAAEGRGRWSTVDSITVANAEVSARRSATGLDVVTWLTPPVDSVVTVAPVAPSRPWATSMGVIQITDSAVRLVDETTATAARWQLNDTQIELARVNLAALDEVVQVRAKTVLAPGGAISIDGEMTLAPFDPQFSVAADNVSLAAFSPYLQDAASLGFSQGVLTARGRLNGRANGVGWSGNARIANVTMVGAKENPLGGWESLELRNLDAVNAPLGLQAESIRWIRPSFEWNVAADGSHNLEGMGSPGAVEAAALSEPSESPVVQVNTIELVEARLRMVDGSVPRTAQLNLQELSGTLTGLSTLDPGRAVVELEGRLNTSASIAIEGNFNPLGNPASSHLRLNFDNINLVPVSGYMAKYGGYGVDRGRLSLDVELKLAERHLESESVATIDGFELGSKVASPDATKLPVPLAVALLKDRAGRIVIDLPVEGNLDDPEFKIGRVVGRVLVNLLTKAATAPFGLLTGLAGGTGDELSHQEFAPGSAELTPSAIEKLNTLSGALMDRPELGLQLTGGFDAESDPPGLRRVLLEQRLREPAGSEGRMQALVGLYTDVFGQPPVDFDAMPASGETAPEPAARPEVSPSSADSRPLFDFIRRIFVGDENTVEAGDPDEPEPSNGVAINLPPLPAEEIEKRLLDRIEIPDTFLRELARERRDAVRAYLVGRGVESSRIVSAEMPVNKPRVELTLR